MHTMNYQLLDFSSVCPDTVVKSVKQNDKVYLSVTDCIKIVCKQDTKHANETFKLLPLDEKKVLEPECLVYCFDEERKILGNIITFKGLIKLLMILPGKSAKTMRLKMSDVVERYLAGDKSLIIEIKCNTSSDHIINRLGNRESSNAAVDRVSDVDSSTLNRSNPQLAKRMASNPQLAKIRKDTVSVQRTNGETVDVTVVYTNYGGHQHVLFKQVDVADALTEKSNITGSICQKVREKCKSLQPTLDLVNIISKQNGDLNAGDKPDLAYFHYCGKGKSVFMTLDGCQLFLDNCNSGKAEENREALLAQLMKAKSNWEADQPYFCAQRETYHMASNPQLAKIRNDTVSVTQACGNTVDVAVAYTNHCGHRHVFLKCNDLAAALTGEKDKAKDVSKDVREKCVLLKPTRNLADFIQEQNGDLNARDNLELSFYHSWGRGKKGLALTLDGCQLFLDNCNSGKAEENRETLMAQLIKAKSNWEAVAVDQAVGSTPRNHKNSKNKADLRSVHLPKPGCVYAMASPAWPGMFKIGRSVNVVKRMSTGNTFCRLSPHRIAAVSPSYDYVQDERLAHIFFAGKKKAGEFFEVTLEEVKSYFDSVIRVKYQKQLKRLLDAHKRHVPRIKAPENTTHSDSNEDNADAEEMREEKQGDEGNPVENGHRDKCDAQKANYEEKYYDEYCTMEYETKKRRFEIEIAKSEDDLATQKALNKVRLDTEIALNEIKLVIEKKRAKVLELQCELDETNIFLSKKKMEILAEFEIAKLKKEMKSALKWMETDVDEPEDTD